MSWAILRKNIFFWLIAVGLFGSLSVLYVGNLLSLPGADRNSQIYSHSYENGEVLAYDQDDRLIENPNGTDPVAVFHNSVKAALVIATVAAFWQLAQIFSRKSLRRFIVFCLLGLLTSGLVLTIGFLTGGDAWDGIAGGPLENTLMQNYLLLLGVYGILVFVCLLLLSPVTILINKFRRNKN